jgi:hypothetical protein
MGLKINGSTSGSIEIDVPAVAGTDTSITIPAKNGGTFIVEESTGNIDLGPLDINGNASDDSVNIDGSGRLLVGTSTARANFNNSTDTTRFQVEGTDAATSSLALICNNGGGVAVASLHLAKSDGSTVGSNGAVGGNWNIGDIRFSGNDGTQFVEAARIEAEIDATPGANDMPGRLVFSTTADGASSPTGRMSITRAGTVSLPSNGASNIFGTPRLAVEGDVSQASAYFRQATTSDIAHIEFRNNNGVVGSIRTSGSSTDYSTSSDYRLKENVVPVTDGITRLQQLNPARFNFIADPNKTVDGFLAHEVQDVVPEAISGEKDAVDDDGNPVYQGIDQSKLVPLLTAALQEAIAKIETLETANASLEARLTALEGGAS